MTQQLILTRGLPASGKSTWAQDSLTAAPENVIRVERDLLRDQLYGAAGRVYALPSDWNMTEAEFKKFVTDRENTVTSVQNAMVDAAVKAGKSVIVSDMNLRAAYVRQWAKKAAEMGVGFTTVKFDDVTLDELISRDNSRQNAVGESVIRMMWQRFTRSGKIADVDVTKELGNTLTIEPYVKPEGKPRAILVDIDGTLAKMSGRSPYEWHRVGEDTPVEAVISAVSDAYQAGKHIVVMSGRDGSCRNITHEWLITHLRKVSDFELFMRAEGDQRKDDLVKYELFNEHVRNNYKVDYVLDDRDQVVAMWRKLGLACFQVEYGAF
jgi:predicted kinase